MRQNKTVESASEFNLENAWAPTEKAGRHGQDRNDGIRVRPLGRCRRSRGRRHRACHRGAGPARRTDHHRRTGRVGCGDRRRLGPRAGGRRSASRSSGRRGSWAIGNAVAGQPATDPVGASIREPVCSPASAGSKRRRPRSGPRRRPKPMSGHGGSSRRPCRPRSSRPRPFPHCHRAVVRPRRVEAGTASSPASMTS
jgi:hypothetical protein